MNAGIEEENCENKPLPVYDCIMRMGGTSEPSFVFCHSAEDCAIPLCGRRDVLERIIAIWRLRRQSFSNSTNRTDYKHPVCVGIPGVGKTRLLEHWSAIFDSMEISQSNRMGLLVLYFNGHGICEADNDHPIEKSFTWRILHRHFFTGSEFRQHMNSLKHSPVYDALSISTAILTVLKTRKGNFDTSNPISFFLGVDEFQSVSGREKDGTNKLERLMTLLYEATLHLHKHNVHLYTMFAGTEGERISDTSSFRHLCARIDISFQRNYSGIVSHLYPESIRSEAFQQYLFTLGNIPRSIVCFTRSVRSACERQGKFPSKDRIQRIRNDVTQSNSNQWRALLNSKSLITLVAYSVSRVAINPSDSPGIALLISGSSPIMPTWQQIADRGLVEITSNGDQSYVSVPYVAIMQCLSCDAGSEGVASLFVASLRVIHDLLSASHEPWYKWKLFGAYFHCLRINAMLLIGRDTVLIHDLFPGAKTSLSTIRPVTIILRPAMVYFADNELSVDSDLKCIPEFENCFRTVNLFSSEFCYVVVNGAGGKGVDLYFLLHTVCEKTVLFQDRRIRDVKSLTTRSISKYVDLMPLSNVDRMLSVCCVFSALASYGERSVKMPNDRCVVVTRKEMYTYHSCFAFHPCIRCSIDPHSSKLSVLEVVLREYMTDKVAEACAKCIKCLCKSKIFLSFESFREALRAHGFMLDDSLQSVFFFANESEEDDETKDDDEMDDNDVIV